MLHVLYFAIQYEAAAMFPGSALKIKANKYSNLNI
jgi:hypothetical protein